MDLSKIPVGVNPPYDVNAIIEDRPDRSLVPDTAITGTYTKTAVSGTVYEVTGRAIGATESRDGTSACHTGPTFMPATCVPARGLSNQSSSKRSTSVRTNAGARTAATSLAGASMRHRPPSRPAPWSRNHRRSETT